MSEEEIRELQEYNLEYIEARNSEDIFGGDYTSAVELKQANKRIEQLEQENKRLIDYLFKTRNELIIENENLKSQLKGTTHCYDEEEHKELLRLVANKVVASYDYDSILKKELIEERRKNVALEESKSIVENILNELESWLEEKRSKMKNFAECWSENIFTTDFENNQILFVVECILDKLNKLKGSDK